MAGIHDPHPVQRTRLMAGRIAACLRACEAGTVGRDAGEWQSGHVTRFGTQLPASEAVRDGGTRLADPSPAVP